MSQAPAPVTIVIHRSLASITADAVPEEQHHSDSLITDHPVESGSVISDNKVRQPEEVVVTYGWSGGSPQNTSGNSTLFLQNLYATLRQIKDSNTMFTLYTGKAVYTNMQIKTISMTTDKETENSLIVRISCREIIIAQTTTITVPIDPTQVADPKKSQASTTRGVQATKPATATPQQQQQIQTFFGLPADTVVPAL